MNDYRITTARFDEEPGIRMIRETVFMAEQGVPGELEWDGLDHEAIHVVARNRNGEVIGTGRLLANGQIGRMAVLPAWRGRGIGSAMLQALLDEARRMGLKRVFLHAQIRALPFYARHGFEAFGETFLDADIPHRAMEHHFDARKET
ncbi:MAG TPA: GNAT family N-acetyltransferase [Gammaproteobacteria bacterium]|nr:GNAT family N-acetyltransferase [Gammaproteobacteria bacterium]